MALINEEIKANCRPYRVSSGRGPMPTESEIVGEKSGDFSELCFSLLQPSCSGRCKT